MLLLLESRKSSVIFSATMLEEQKIKVQNESVYSANKVSNKDTKSRALASIDFIY